MHAMHVCIYILEHPFGVQDDAINRASLSGAHLRAEGRQHHVGLQCLAAAGN